MFYLNIHFDPLETVVNGGAPNVLFFFLFSKFFKR